MPLIHKLDEFFKSIYSLSGRLPKRDRFGIHSKIENLCLNAWELAISAAFAEKQNKPSLLAALRVKIEILKRLIRLEHDLNIIPSKTYINTEKELQEISKMTNGWIKYLTQRELK